MFPPQFLSDGVKNECSQGRKTKLNECQKKEKANVGGDTLSELEINKVLQKREVAPRLTLTAKAVAVDSLGRLRR